MFSTSACSEGRKREPCAGEIAEGGAGGERGAPAGSVLPPRGLTLTWASAGRRPDGSRTGAVAAVTGALILVLLTRV